MSNVVSMGEKANNSMMVSPRDALESALDEIGKSGAFEHGKKLLIICLDDSDNCYFTSFRNAGLKSSECIALLEHTKAKFMDILLGKE